VSGRDAVRARLARRRKTRGKEAPVDPYVLPEHFRPFPELVAGDSGAYTIHDSLLMPELPTDGMTSKTERQLWVPWQAGGRMVSRHELGHVLISPTQLPRVRFPLACLMAVEDARVNTGLANLGVGLDLEREQADHVVALARSDLRRGMPAALVLRAVAATGTNVETRLLAVIERAEGAARLIELVETVRERLERARRRSGGYTARFPTALKLARWLASDLGDLGLYIPESMRVCISCCQGEPVDGEDGDEQMSLPFLDTGAQSGKMRVTTAPLTQPCPPIPQGRARSKRSAEEGVSVKNVYRYLADGRVFSAPARRRGGGTVLIDVSGSMSLSSDDVDRIIRDAPEATLVAIYSGHDQEGELRVVVKGGRRTSAEHLTPAGAGNVVDVPALEWLARQKGPRVWLSDGGVTGCGDRSTAGITSSCRQLRRRATIKRVETAEQAASFLSGRYVKTGHKRAVDA